MAKYEARARIEKVKTGSGATRYYVEREFKHDGVWRGFETITGLEEWEAKREAARSPKTVDIEDGTERQHTKSKVQNDYAASARNAKFKVGDKIKIVADAGAWRKGEKGTIIGGDYLPGYFLVKFDGGSEGRIPEEKMDVANSRACNAKFKKGDRVVATKPDYQTKGVGVVRGYEYSWDEEVERDDPGWYIVDFPNQYKVKMGKGSLRLANSRACNDILGRYKPGARVSVEIRTRPIIGKVIQYGGRPIVEYSPTTRTRFTGTLIKQNGNKWDIKSDSGEIYKDVREADLGLIYNSRACNAKFKAGDKVYVRWLGSDEEYATVISYDPKGDFYIVRGEDGQLVRPKASLLVAANSCGVRSTIPAVNAALGANAVKPGDMVKVEWEYYADKKGIVGMTGEVLKISSGIATVAIREKRNREYIVAVHALRKIANAARNDMTRPKFCLRAFTKDTCWRRSDSHG
jgi:hypothetical protein